MSSFKITYAEAKEYPEYAQIEKAKIDKKKSKLAHICLEDYKWTIVVVVRISVSDIFGPKPESTIDEQLKMFLKNSSAHLNARYRQSVYMEKLKEMPQFIIDYQEKEYQKCQQRRDNFKALTPVEQQLEIIGLIDKLKKDTGFVHLLHELIEITKEK